jgi:uncharacterized membrane protein YfcA
MLVAFARYSRDDSFVALRTNAGFATAMTAGSITGTIIGGLLLGIVPTTILVPALVALLLLSAGACAGQSPRRTRRSDEESGSLGGPAVTVVVQARAGQALQPGCLP